MVNNVAYDMVFGLIILLRWKMDIVTYIVAITTENHC